MTKITKANIEQLKFKLTKKFIDQFDDSEKEYLNSIGWISFTWLQGKKSLNSLTARNKGVMPIYAGETVTSIKRMIKDNELELISEFQKGE